MPFEKGNKLGKGRRPTKDIPPFTMPWLKERWDQINELLADDSPEARQDVHALLKWIFPLACGYMFGKPTEKVEHSGDITITVNLSEKSK